MQAPNTVPKALIFDLDGVITDTAHFHFVAWRELGRSLGIDFDEGMNESLKGISRMESLERILIWGGREHAFSASEKVALATQKNQAYLQLLTQLSPTDVLPGIVTLIQTARLQNVKTAVASASKNAPTILQALDIADLFDCVVDPESVPAGKPAPDIFLKAAQSVGVMPHECVGFEDAVAGVQAIVSANMLAIGVGSPAELASAGAHIVVNSTAALTWDFVQTTYAQAASIQ